MVKFAPLLIVTPLAITLSVFALLPLRFEGVGVGRAGIEGERALDRES